MFRGLTLFVIAFCVFGTAGKAVAENPLYKTYLNAGWKARQAKNYAEAEKSYLCAARLNPKSSEPKVGLLYTYIENEDFKRAEFLADQYLESDPDNLWIRKGAAWTFYNRRRYDDAIAQYSYVLQEAGEDPMMTLGLGLSLYYAGRKEEARETCLSCQEHFDENDDRLKLCLGEKEWNWNDGQHNGIEEQKKVSQQEWRVSPSVFFTYTDYSDSFTKESSETLTTGLEILHMYGLGFYLQGSVMKYSKKESNESYKQYSTSYAVFYYTPATSVWVNLTRLNGDEDGDVSSEILSLYGSRRFDSFHVGFERSKGEYGDFTTTQYKPELGFYWGEHYFVKLSGMLQKSSGDVYSMFQENPDEMVLSLTEIKTRSSIGLDFTLTYELFSLTFSGYSGERWFTVEDRGLNVWNVDEEFEWGSKVNLDYHPTKNRAYYLSVRGDKVNMQSGFENEFYTIGVTTGIQFVF